MTTQVGRDRRIIDKVYVGSKPITKIYHMGELVFNANRIKTILFGSPLSEDREFVSVLTEDPETSVAESMFHITGDDANGTSQTYTPNGSWVQEDGTILLYAKKGITIDGVSRNEYRFYIATVNSPTDVETAFIDNGGVTVPSTDDRSFTNLVNTEKFIYGSDSSGKLAKINKETNEIESTSDFLADGNVLFKMENVLAHVETEDGSSHMRIYDFDLRRQRHLDFEYSPPTGVSHVVGDYDFYVRGYFFIANPSTGEYTVFRHDYDSSARSDSPQSFVHTIDFTEVDRTEKPTNPSGSSDLSNYFNTNSTSEAVESRILSTPDPLGFANVKSLTLAPTIDQRKTATSQDSAGPMIYEDDDEIIIFASSSSTELGDTIYSIDKSDNSINGSIAIPDNMSQGGVIEKIGGEYYYYDHHDGGLRFGDKIYKTSSIESTSTWTEITLANPPGQRLGVSYAARLFWYVHRNSANTQLRFKAYNIDGTEATDRDFTYEPFTLGSVVASNTWGFGRWIIVRNDNFIKIFDVTTQEAVDIALGEDLLGVYFKLWRNKERFVIGERITTDAISRGNQSVSARTQFIAPTPPLSLPVVGFDSVVISRGVRQIAPRIRDLTNRVRAFLDNTGSGLENKAVGYAANNDTTTFYYVPNNTGLRITSSDGYYSVTVSTDSSTTNVGRICLETDNYIWFVHSQYIGTAPNYTSASHRLGRIKKSDRTSEFFTNFSTSTTEAMVGLEILDDDYIGVVSSNKVYIYTKEDGTRDTEQDITLSTAIPSSSLVYSGIAVNNDGNGSLTFTNHEGKSVTTRFPGIVIDSAADIYTLSSDRTRLYFGLANQGSGADPSYHPIKFFRSPTYPTTQLSGTTITASDSQGITFDDNYLPVGPALDAKGMILTSTAGVRRLNEDNTVTQLATFVNALSNRFDKVLETETDIYGYTESTTTLVRVRKSTGAILYTNSSVTLPEAVSQNRPQTTAVIGMDIFGPGSLIGIIHSEGITLFNDDCTVNDTYGSTTEFGTFTRQRYSARRAGAGLVIENEGGAFQYRDYVNNIVVTADQSIGTQGGATDLIYSRDGTQMLTHDGTNWFKWTISWN